MDFIIWDSVLKHNVSDNNPVVTINLLHLRKNYMFSSVSEEEKLISSNKQLEVGNFYNELCGS